MKTLAFEPRRRDAFHEMLLRQEKDDRRRHDGQQRHRQQLAPLNLELVDEHAQREPNGIFFDRAQIQHLPEEIVPAPDEGEDRYRDESGPQQREDDPHENAVHRRPVHFRRLVQIPRDAPDELHEQEDEERSPSEKMRQNERNVAVHEPERIVENILRHDRHLPRQHHRQQQNREPEAAQLERDAGEAVGDDRARQNCAEHAPELHHQRIGEKVRKRIFGGKRPAFRIVLPHRRFWPNRGQPHFLVFLERCPDPPEHRVQHKQRNGRQQDVVDDALDAKPGCVHLAFPPSDS